MIFTDPSGDEGIHPVDPLQLPIVIPPPSGGEVIHRTNRSVITYSKRLPKNQHSKVLSKSLHVPIEVEHFHYQVKELLDDGTSSTVDKPVNQLIFTEKVQKKTNKKKGSTLKTTKFLNDGSALLKQEIQSSDERVYRVKAGKALSFLIPRNTKEFIGPNKSEYNRESLGTPRYPEECKNLSFSGRRKQVSLMNSSPQRPFIFLPSLKEILLNNEQSQEGIFEKGSDLTQKFDKLDKTLVKNNRKDLRIVKEGRDKTLVNIAKNYLKGFQINESLKDDSVSHLMDRCVEYGEGKKKIRNNLTDLLATQKYDRPETIWLKYKHFKTTEKASVYQGRMVDIWNMRMKAEKERLEQNREMIAQICWYRDILWFTIEKCNDISPYTYFVLDYIKALTEECVQVTRERMLKAFESIPIGERTNGLNLLMSKILIDLSSAFTQVLKTEIN